MIFKAKGPLMRIRPAMDRGNKRLVFYGRSHEEVAHWLYEHRNEGWPIWGRVHIYKGSFVKTVGTKSRAFDSSSTSDYGGVAANTATDPFAGPVIEGVMLATGLEQVRYFTAAYYMEVDAAAAAARSPNVMHGQRDISYMGSYGGSSGTQDTLSMALLVGGKGPGILKVPFVQKSIPLAGQGRGVSGTAKKFGAPRAGGRRTKLGSIFGSR